MATLINILDDIRDLYNDPTDAKVSRAMKVRYVNRAQKAMWPKVHRVVRDATVPLVADTFEYLIPAALAQGKIMGIECETTPSSSRFVQLRGLMFDIVPGTSDSGVFVLKSAALPAAAGSSLRITAAVPLTDLSADGDTYTGPAVTEELPVLYAMSMLMARDMEARLNMYRFSTTQALNGTLLEDFSNSAAYWMAAFERLLEQVQMPLSAP